ncbi:MAG TPA: GNAT family N-acetyltransferase [Patescibacteria group bacterium]|nr:GNAT family N-acetyltransferase [Patescibacteria group bacterium]
MSNAPDPRRLADLSALPVLDSERLHLRPIREDDLPDLFAVFADPDVMRYWTKPPMRDVEEARSYLAGIERHFAARTAFKWAITRKGNDRLIGTTSLFRLDGPHNTGEIGYALGSAHWGNGYAAEAVHRTCRFGFDELHLRRIEADIDPRNHASIQVIEKAGFQREGVLRERYIYNDEIQDVVYYGLLAREFTR